MSTASIRIAPDVLHRTLGGETVVMNLDSGETFSLDRWGRRTWELIERFGEHDRVAEALCDEFEVDRSTVERDLDAFLSQLQAKGLVEIG